LRKSKKTLEVLCPSVSYEPVDNISPYQGIYSGTIGYIGCDNTADLNIVIRTAVIAGRTIRVGSGGAIVAMSDIDEVMVHRSSF
jgi:anthranilate/para-aminobenzoate synthase component I